MDLRGCDGGLERGEWYVGGWLRRGGGGFKRDISIRRRNVSYYA